MKTNKTTTIFVPVKKDVADDFRNDVYYLNDKELIDYIVGHYKSEDVVLVEDCPFECEDLNFWDDEVLEDVFFDDEKEYKKAIKEMNKVLGVKDSDEFIKTHWVVEVKGSMEDFKKRLSMAYEKQVGVMSVKPFALSGKDKEMLLSWGYREEDFKQIEDAANVGSYETDKGKRVSWLTARRIVGVREFLSGIARAAFHWTAMRSNSRNVRIYMDFGNYFRNED